LRRRQFGWYAAARESERTIVVAPARAFLSRRRADDGCTGLRAGAWSRPRPLCPVRAGSDAARRSHHRQRRYRREPGDARRAQATDGGHLHCRSEQRPAARRLELRAAVRGERTGRLQSSDSVLRTGARSRRRMCTSEPNSVCDCRVWFDPSRREGHTASLAGGSPFQRRGEGWRNPDSRPGGPYLLPPSDWPERASLRCTGRHGANRG
jgi:hypothetical protein